MAESPGIDAKARDLWWFRKNVPCLDACPVKTDAGRYVQLIAEGRLAEAYRVARAPNPIASVCGRAAAPRARTLAGEVNRRSGYDSRPQTLPDRTIRS